MPVVFLFIESVYLYHLPMVDCCFRGLTLMRRAVVCCLLIGRLHTAAASMFYDCLCPQVNFSCVLQYSHVLFSLPGLAAALKVFHLLTLVAYSILGWVVLFRV